ncbi:MAG TPA: GGDEF domain-containing protein [Pirellulales bacterium]|nr:GGDEF domain-containing protein [Pirellulales bacterium]
MIGFVLGLLFGGAIASGSLYAVYLWAHSEKLLPGAIKPATSPIPAPTPPPKPSEPEIVEVPAVQPDPPPLVPATPAEPAIVPMETTASTGGWLGKLSQRIEGEIGSHSFRIEEISASLRTAKEGEPDVVLDAASRIMLANQQLQAELAAARVEIDEHRAKVRELSAEARTDILTGLANRRAFVEELERRFEQWRRHKVPLSLVMVDIDHFKSINDAYTHAGGDAALRHMGELLRVALRQMDVPARYGGEEFAVILPGTKLPDAVNVCERLRATIAAKPFSYEFEAVPLTASLGMATATADDTATSLIERADQALYAAKQGGRNRAYVHDGDSYVPIETDKALVRHPFRDLQQIAPYRLGGPLPRASDFYPVRCYDLSVRGISFLSTVPPDFQAVVIRLGNPPDARYMISSIANVAPVMSGDEKQYRVGCTFVSRLDPEEMPHDEAEQDAEPQFARS